MTADTQTKHSQRHHQIGYTMTKQWTIWTSAGYELNCHVIENYDTALRMIQAELEDGYFDLDDMMIYELDELETNQ
jgi:hypothetical protein